MIPGAKQNPPTQPAENPNKNGATKADTKNTTAPPTKPDPPKDAPKVKPPKPPKRKSKPKKKSKNKSKSKSPKAKKQKQRQRDNEPLPKLNQNMGTATAPKPPLPPKSQSKAKINTSSPKPVPAPVPAPRAVNSKLNLNDYSSRKYSAPPDPDVQRQRQFYGSTEIPNQQTDDDNTNTNTNATNTPQPEAESEMEGNQNSSSRSSKAAISSPAQSRQPSLKSPTLTSENPSRVPSQIPQPSLSARRSTNSVSENKNHSRIPSLVKSPVSENLSRVPSEITQLSPKSSPIPISPSPPRKQSQNQMQEIETFVQSPLALSKKQSRIPSANELPVATQSPINTMTPPRKQSQTQSQVQETFVQSPIISRQQSQSIPSEMKQLSPPQSQSPVNSTMTPPRRPSQRQSQVQEISAQSPFQSQSPVPFSRNPSRVSTDMNQFTVLPMPVPMPVPTNTPESLSRKQSPSQSPMKETAIQSPISTQQSRKQSQNQELTVKSPTPISTPKRMSTNASIVQSQMNELHQVESPIMRNLSQSQSRSSYPISNQNQELPLKRESRLSNQPSMFNQERQSQGQLYPIPIPTPAPVPVPVQSTRNLSPVEKLSLIQPNINVRSNSNQSVHRYSFTDLKNTNANPDPTEPPSQNNNSEPPEPIQIDYTPNDGYVPNWDSREKSETLKIFSTQKGDDPQEQKIPRSEEEILWNPGFVCHVLLITSLTHYVYFALATISSNIDILPKVIGDFFWVPLSIFIILSIFSRIYEWSRESPGSIIIFLTFITLWSMFWTLLARFLSPSPIVPSIVETVASNCFILAVCIRIKGNFNLKSGTIYVLAFGVLFFHLKVKVAVAFLEFFTTHRQKNDFSVQAVEKILLNVSISNGIGGIIFLYICFELKSILLGNRPIAWPTQCIYGALSLYEDIIWLLYELARLLLFTLLLGVCYPCISFTPTGKCCSCRCKNRRNSILKK